MSKSETQKNERKTKEVVSMEWILMYVVAEGFIEQETWYTNKTEDMWRIVFSDGSEVITDDPGYYDD
jgi:hypothetical protein